MVRILITPITKMRDTKGSTKVARDPDKYEELNQFLNKTSKFQITEKDQAR